MGHTEMNLLRNRCEGDQTSVGTDGKSPVYTEEQKLQSKLSLASERACYLFTCLSDEKYCITLIVTDQVLNFWEEKIPREEEVFAVHVNTS